MAAYREVSHKGILSFLALFVFIITIVYHINQILQNNSNFLMAYAHQTSKYGNFTLEYGWAEEPVLIDEINNVVVGVTTDSENNSSFPVRNALTDMEIKVKYGGLTKDLDFVPAQEEAGLYEAEIFPTRLGSYSLVINGTIQDQRINDEVEIEDVESKQRISFPEANSGSSNDATNTNLLSGQISSILNQITNDINNIRDDIGTLAESNSNIQGRVQDVKNI
ncbi:MAG: hypothetical protein ACRD5J_20640, partial [Nitrososphaeraceae archaeon]